MAIDALMLAVILSAKCEVACQYEGFTSGHYEAPYCVCETRLVAETLVSLDVKSEYPLARK